MTAIDCGFNRSMQHLISDYREEDVENEAATEDLLQRSPKGDDVGSVAARRGENCNLAARFIPKSRARRLYMPSPRTRYLRL